MSHSNIFSEISSQARKTKGKNKQIRLHQTKIFCTAKESINKRKRQPTEWESTLTNDTSGKRLISKVYKEPIQPNMKETNNPVLKMGKGPR